MTFDLSKLTKYMEIVDATTKLSKDASTKVGALILGPSFEARNSVSDYEFDKVEGYGWFLPKG